MIRRRGGGGNGPTSRAHGYRVRQKRERGDRLRDGSAAPSCAETPVEDENNNCWHLRAETTYNHSLALSAFPAAAAEMLKLTRGRGQWSRGRSRFIVII